MFVLKALCVAVIIFVRPVYSHPHHKGVTNLIHKPSFEHAAVRHMHDMHATDTTHFAHRLVTKRQVSNVTADEHCYFQLLDIYCSSGYFPLLANTYLNCGERDNARLYANFCAQNAMGEYCHTVYYKLNPDLDYIDGNCSASLTSGSCHANCSTQLQLLKDKLGCCPFEYFNSSYSYRSVFDYQLWNLCDIPLSIPPCRIVRISQTNQRTCTHEEFTKTYSQGFCQPGGVGQNFVNKILDKERCSHILDLNSTALSFVQYCSLNPNGEYCGVIDDDGTLSSTVRNISNRCYSSYGGECYQACADTITEANRSFGCCINLYDHDSAVSDDLWNSCGVELPGTCKSTLSLTPSGSGSKSLVQGGITIWVIVALVVFIQC